MSNISNIFGGKAFIPPKPLPPADPVQQLYNALLGLGDIRLQQRDIIPNGQIHRFQIGGKRNQNGWYVLHNDAVAAGAYGDWAQGVTQYFQADIGRDMTAAEKMAYASRLADIRRARAEAESRKHEAVADVVSSIWSSAPEASPSHPYLSRKRISAHGARLADDGRLLVPVTCPDTGELLSLQYIAGDGEKRFRAGGKVKGGFFHISGTEGGPVYLVEGFADAATVSEATGAPVYAALSADNMPPLATWLRERYGELGDIVLVQDNDDSGTGQHVAKEAAERSGCRIVALPGNFGDISDYHVAGHDVAALLSPKVDLDFLVPVSEFVKQPAPIRWLVKGWLQHEAMMMLFGPSGAGKSFISIDMACHIAGGLDSWNGCKVRGGTVVYLAGEGHHGMKARIAGWLAANGNPKLDMYVSQHGTDLNTGPGYSRVVDAMRAAGIQPVLIIVDTLHRFLHGDENSAEDAKTMIDACNQLMRDFDCSVQLVHHTGVSPEAQKRGRGSSAWKGALDIEICVSDSTISQTKTKDSEPCESLLFELVSHDVPGWVDEDGDQVTTALVQISGVKQGADDLHAEKQVFMNAWAWADYDLDDAGRPHITTAALARWLVSEGGHKDSTAQRYARTAGSRKGKQLIDSGYLMAYRHGFSLLDNQAVSIALMQLNDIRKKK